MLLLSRYSRAIRRYAEYACYATLLMLLRALFCLFHAYATRKICAMPLRLMRCDAVAAFITALCLHML